MVTPRIAGLLRTESGVSPCGVDQSMSPLSRLILTIWPYGGLTIGTPWITVPPPKPPSGAAPPRPPAAPPRPAPAAPAAAAGGAGGAGAAPRCGASAALPSPPPTIGRKVV